MDFYPIDYEASFSDIDTFQYSNRKVGVIVHIENDKGEISLQQRGNNSRDDKCLYEDIGGKVESEDYSFKDAIIREIKEETGENIDLEFSNSIGIFHCLKKDINWVFVIYFAKYINGHFKIMEPDKCKGYKFFTYNEAMNSNLVSKSCKYLIKNIKGNQ